MLDHKMFLNMLFSGSRRVIEHRDELNSINVFPVPDGDTGSNLSHLMRTILQDTSISDDASESMASLKQAALRGGTRKFGNDLFTVLHPYRRVRNMTKVIP